MSNLASFSNKTKADIYNVCLTKNKFFVKYTCCYGYEYLVWLLKPSQHTFKLNSPILLYFNKKEKILETEDKILIIKLFKDTEENFWKVLEENVKLV